MRTLSILLIAIGIVMLTSSGCASTATSPAADPLTGRWEGTWGPSPERQTNVVLELKWDGTHLTGFVNPGGRSAALTKASFNPGTSAITMELDVRDVSEKTDHYAIQGKVDGKKMSGTWTRSNGHGDFNITKD